MNIILIYTGQVELVKGGLGAKYILETPVEGLEDAMIFKKRLLGSILLLMQSKALTSTTLNVRR